jgi:mannose-6-phosphate isomerase-like protein (cupin superfamily)
MNVRVVVTGHDADGKAVFASDREVEPVSLDLLPGAEFHQLWGADRVVSLPDDGAQPEFTSYFPPVGGFRVGFFSVPPEGGSRPEGLDVGAAIAQAEERLPGLLPYMEPNGSGMHTTPTVDFEVVLEGEVWLELDDGNEVHLRPGDCLVQNGTRHAWHNHGTETARLAVFIVGAEHAKF